MTITTNAGESDDVSGSSAFVIAAALTALFVYALLLPLLIGLEPVLDGSPWASAALTLLTLSIYSGARIAYELSRGASRWFVLVFHSFAYIFLGIAPLAQIAAGSLYWTANPTAHVVFEAAVVCLVGVLLFDVGSIIGGTKRRHNYGAFGLDASADVRSGEAAREPRKPLSWLTAPVADRALVLLMATSLLSIGVLVVRGGLPYVLASRTDMSAVLCPGIPGDLTECGIVTALVRVPPVILTIVSLGLVERGHRQLVWAAVLLGVVGLFLTANPVSQARFWFGAAAVGVLGVIARRHLRRRVIIWLAAPLLLVLVFPSLDFGRYRDWTPEFNFGFDAVVEKRDFDAFQQIINGVTYVETFGARDGAQMSSAVLFFVPRSIWREKAPATGELVSSSLGSGFTNVSAPLWEEAYVDFGLAGVAITLGFLGFVVSKLETAIALSRRLKGGLLVSIAPFFAGYGVFLLRGALLPAIGTLAVAALLVTVVARLSRTSPKRTEEEYVTKPHAL